ncbi:tyrosine-type recombinase/integrase [Streptomyces mirabilis]
MWSKRSWRPALATAGVVKKVGEKAETYGGRSRRYPVYELSREDMFHVLRHTYASTRLEAGESIVSVSEWLGHASPQTTLTHYAHFMSGRASGASQPWTSGSIKIHNRMSLRTPWAPHRPRTGHETAGGSGSRAH